MVSGRSALARANALAATLQSPAPSVDDADPASLPPGAAFLARGVLRMGVAATTMNG